MSVPASSFFPRPRGKYQTAFEPGDQRRKTVLDSHLPSPRAEPGTRVVSDGQAWTFYRERHVSLPEGTAWRHGNSPFRLSPPSRVVTGHLEVMQMLLALHKEAGVYRRCVSRGRIKWEVTRNVFMSLFCPDLEGERVDADDCPRILATCEFSSILIRNGKRFTGYYDEGSLVMCLGNAAPLLSCPYSARGNAHRREIK